MPGFRRSIAAAMAFVLMAGLASGAAPAVNAAVLPAGFREVEVFRGLVNPTSVEFASDGRVFVAEKRGTIKVFDSLNDTTPDTFADLSASVHNFWDRGLLGLALDPAFPTNPTSTSSTRTTTSSATRHPRWHDGRDHDCPSPPAATGDGCVVSGRLSRLTASGNAMTGTEQVLVEDWCQQYPSHSSGASRSGPTARSTHPAATGPASTSPTTARPEAAAGTRRRTRAAIRRVASGRR